MKNLLILIVAAAVYLHFYPQPELEQWYQDKKNSALTSFNDATDTRVQLSNKKVYSDLEPSFNHFTPEEVVYAKEITADTKKIISFYKAHCEKPEPDFNFQTTNQKTVCKVIGRYTNYF